MSTDRDTGGKGVQVPRCRRKKPQTFKGKQTLISKSTVWSLIMKVQKIGANSEKDWRYWYSKAVAGETDLGTSNWEEVQVPVASLSISRLCPVCPRPCACLIFLFVPLWPARSIYIHRYWWLSKEPTISHALIFPRNNDFSFILVLTCILQWNASWFFNFSFSTHPSVHPFIWPLLSAHWVPSSVSLTIKK